MENHDQPRCISRFGTEDPRYRATCAKMLATFLLSLRGTPFLYQGQELGVPHPQNWSLEDYKDVETQRYYKQYVFPFPPCPLVSVLIPCREYDRRKKEDPSKEPDMSDVMYAIKKKGRDNARTPMHWDTTPNSGFTGPTVKPWLKLNDGYADINVVTQRRDPDSVLNYFRRMLHMRKQHPLLVRFPNR